MKNDTQGPFGKALSLVKSHKIISAILVIVIVAGGYYAYAKSTAGKTSTQYVLGQVERGTLISSVSGTGQIEASNQLDVKPKVSGDITSVNVVSGQQVKVGAVLAQIDARDALQSLSVAKTDLTSATIDLEKTKISSAQTAQNSGDSLTKAYDAGFSTLSDSFASLSPIIDDVTNILNNRTRAAYFDYGVLRAQIGNSATDKKDALALSLESVQTEYNSLYKDYGKLSHADTDSADKLIAGLYSTSVKLADSLKNIRSFMNVLQNNIDPLPQGLTADETTLNQDISTVNGKTAALLSAQSSINSAKADLAAATQTYSQISGSNDALDVQTAQLALDQKRNAYQKALDNLADYTVRAPFDGEVATSPVQKGDNVSSGTIVATLITKQKVASISLNEVDEAKVKAGQKVTLTFDAITDLSISGQILEVDPIGTVTQGVVNYNIKIGLDTQDDRVKPGMSVSASIITDSKANILLVPSSAIKTDTNGSYVEVPNGTSANPTPQQVPVEIGSTNDTQTEIVSGLTEGEQIITRTISGTTPTATQTSNRSVLGVPTGGGGGARTGGRATFGG